MATKYIVPFIDLKAQDADLREEIQQAIAQTLEESNFIKGQSVSQFEQEFSSLFPQHPDVISLGNGTDALFITLKILGIKTGDEVITPALSWISSAEVISMVGARPVFADIDPVYYTISPQEIINNITPQTKAVIVVHLFGQAAAMDEIAKICSQHNIYLIEDCAQAHLTRFGEQVTGTFGVASCFSFYPTKNLGAYGDAGCIVTSDRSLSTKIRRFANHGALTKDDHAMEGFNSRMDTIQAAILLVKMKSLSKGNVKRNAIASKYTELLSSVKGVTVPAVRPNTYHTHHIYPIQTVKRDELKMYLQSRGIQTLIHYPKALTNLEFYQSQHSDKSFPIATSFEKRCLSLPISPALTMEQVELVGSAIVQFFE